MLRLRRSVVAVPLAAALAAAAPAVAAAPVAPALKSTLAKLKTKTKLPILLPSSLPVDSGSRKLYPLIATSSTDFSVNLGLNADCEGVNACSVGSIGAKKTAKTPSSSDGKYKVSLHGGVTGRYQPLSCGANCTPPAITFRSAGVNTTFQLKLLLAKGETDRSVLTKLANQALDAGPR